jgi:hypothetical protein
MPSDQNLVKFPAEAACVILPPPILNKNRSVSGSQEPGFSNSASFGLFRENWKKYGSREGNAFKHLPSFLLRDFA